MKRQSKVTEPANKPEGLAVRRIRLVLMWVVVATACYLAYGFGRLWAEWRQTAQQLPGRESVSAQITTKTLFPLAGQWSFADLDWDLKSRVVDADRVDLLLESLADQSTPNDDQQLPDIEDELLELAKSLRIEPVYRGGNWVYHFDRGDLKASMVVRIVDGKSKAVALAAAYPHSGDRWQFIELTPGQSSSRPSNVEHLLPLPHTAGRTGGRFADDGTLLLELVVLESNADELLSQWKNAGWEVRPSGLGGPDDFSYLCARGDDVIYAWSANPRDALQNVMLVRSPSPADTSRQ